MRPRRTPRFALFFAACLLSLAPWPIYVDVATWTLIWRPAVLSFSALPPGTVPMPVGALGFAAFCVVNTLKLRGLSIRTEGVALSPSLTWLIVAVTAVLFAANILAGGSTTKFIQLYVILFAVFILRLPYVESDLRYLSKWVFTSFFVVIAIHIRSILLSEHFGEDAGNAYATFLDGSVHGALVSYPAVVLLYGVVLLIKSVNARRQVTVVALATVAVLLALFADRRETAVQVLLLSIALVSAVGMLAIIGRNRRLLVRCAKMAVLTLPPIIYSVYMGYVTSFDRIASAGDDPRVEIWTAAMPKDFVQFLVGNLQASNTAHSFGFSLLASFGILGLVPMILLTFGVIRFVTRKRPALTTEQTLAQRRTVATRRLILIAFAINIISSNVLNTNITQPYYVVNVIVLFMLLRTPDTGLVLLRRG